MAESFNTRTVPETATSGLNDGQMVLTVIQAEFTGSILPSTVDSEPLPGSETRHLSETDLQPTGARVSLLKEVGTAFHGKLRPIVLEVENQLFELPAQETIVIGRKSVAHGNYPLDVDLDFFGALGKGVSRQHIMIIRKDTLVYVCDMNTINGTWLNGQKLVSTSERLLRDGDQLRLGQLKIRVHFQ